MLNPYLEKKSPAFLFPSEFFKKVGEEKKMNKQRFMTTVDKPHVVKKRVHKLFKKVVQYCTIFYV